MLPGDIIDLLNSAAVLKRGLEGISVEDVAKDLRELHDLLRLVRREHGSVTGFIQHLNNKVPK